MAFSDRVIAVKGKVRFYRDELEGLKGGGVRYAVPFGLMLILLFPVLVIEVIILLAFGIDAEINQTRWPEISSEMHEEEVPKALRQLIPVAIKWGIGDAEERQSLMNVTSISELNEIERMVGPRMQQITEWIDTYSETELRESATAGYFIFLQVAYDELSTYLDQREA
jgi:hypothetical protein